MKNTFLPLLLMLALSTVLMQAHAASTASSHSPDTANLALASVYAKVVSLDSNATLYAKHADVAAPIASITKLMTAMVVLDSGQPLGERITIVERERDPQKNAYSRIRVGSQATRGDLLRIALMSSENLASYVLARHHPGGFDAFVAAMNDKARALGMSRTRFVDPAGLSPDNQSTASDLAKMVAAAHRYGAIREMSTMTYHRVEFRGPRYTLDYGNTNPLVGSSRWEVTLSKTGYLNEAGRCLVMVAEIGGQRVAMVLLDSLGTRTPLGDAGRIRRWIETGSSGTIAGPARDYERTRTAAIRHDGGPQTSGNP